MNVNHLNACKDCGKDCMDDPKDYYMIRFDLWDQYGVGRGMLCMSCMEIRLGRKLTADDIFPCPLTKRFNPYTKLILEQNENLVNGDTSN